MNSTIQKQKKDDDEKVVPKKNFFQRLMGGEESSTMLTVVIVIIGIVLLLLIGFLIYRKMSANKQPVDVSNISDTSDNIPTTFSGTPNESATSDVTTTELPAVAGTGGS